MRPTPGILSVTVALVLWGLITHGTYAGQGDEPHYLAIAHSIAFDRDFDLSNNYGPREPLISGGGLEPENHARPGMRGILRPVHDVGLPLILAPYVSLAVALASSTAPYAGHPLMRRFRLTPSILYRHLLSFAMIVVAVLLARLTLTVLLETGASRVAAFWTAMLVSLSPPLLIFGVLFFTEMISAVLALFVFRRAALAPEADSRHWALAGAATGLLLLIHIKNAGVALPLAMIVCATLLRRRLFAQLLAFVGAVTVLFALRTAVTYRFWGSLLTTPHAKMGEWNGWADMTSIFAVRLAGLALDQEFGLLPYAPMFIVAGFGLLVLWRREPSLAFNVTGVVACHLLFISLPITNVHGWTGGWSPGGRFVTPVVPLLAIPLSMGMRQLPRGLVATFVGCQILVNAYMWQNPKNLWNDGDGVAAICQRGGATFCQYLPSIPPR